jgi:hypothetical protein
MNRQALLFIFILTFFSESYSIGQDSYNIRELFPGKDVFKGWEIKDSIEIYNVDNLYYYIDGGADIYIEYGFLEAATCKYFNSSGSDIRIEIYRMTSDTAAFGIFTINSSDNGEQVEFGNLAYLYNYNLDFWKGPWFVRCTSVKKDVGSMDTLILIAGLVNAKIADTGKESRLTNVFRIDGMQFTDIRYITGIIGLNNVYNFGNGVIAGFTDGVIGSCNEKMLFAFRYASEHVCREWFASAKGKVQMNKKFTGYTPAENGFTIQHKEGIDFSFVQYKQFILIVKGMGWEEAQPVFDQVGKNLSY